MNYSSSPRYEYIFSLTLVVVLGLAIVLLLDGNPNTLRAQLGGDIPPITVSWLLIALLSVITSTAADLLARAHPELQSRDLPTIHLGFTKLEVVPDFWILPSYSLISSFAFFRLFNSSLHGIAFILALGVAGGLVLVVLLGQHYALNRQVETQQPARLVLQIIGYFLAFGCFSAIFYAHLRTLYAAPLIGVTGGLLAYKELQWSACPDRKVIAFFMGLLLGEATWALNYWSANFLLSGTLLLVIFYIAVSLIYHQTAGTLQRRLLIEYSLLGCALLIMVILVSFRA